MNDSFKTLNPAPPKFRSVSMKTSRIQTNNVIKSAATLGHNAYPAAPTGLPKSKWWVCSLEKAYGQKCFAALEEVNSTANDSSNWTEWPDLWQRAASTSSRVKNRVLDTSRAQRHLLSPLLTTEEARLHLQISLIKKHSHKMLWFKILAWFKTQNAVLL